MFVKWNENRLKIVPRMKKQKSGIVKLGNIMLIPGVNFIKDNQWEEVKDIVDFDIKKGKLEVFTKGVPGNKQVPAKVEELPETAISETNDLGTLKEMKKQTHKDVVKSEIKDQEDVVKEELKKGGRDKKKGAK